MERRDFLKKASIAAGALTLAGAAGIGYQSGISKESFIGWGGKAFGKDQFFNRKAFVVDKPTYEQMGEPGRIRYVEELFFRNGQMRRLLVAGNNSEASWRFEQGVEALPAYLKDYYQANPGALEEFQLAFETGQNQRIRHEAFSEELFLAEAFSAAHSSTTSGPTAYPPQPQAPPEVSDFAQVNPRSLPLKSSLHGSELIKAMAYSFGASLVGIAKLKQEWVYMDYRRGVGLGEYPFPPHWKYAVVIAIPHEWDSLYAAPNFGTSFDAYSSLRMVAGKLEVFLKRIGYSARSHVPPTSYELVLPPLAIDAGLGEQGRHGMLITPELGANAILAAVTTDMPLEFDKPIDIGIKKFCEKCKICAEECPSGAISFDAKPSQIIRGFKRWVANAHKCYKFWTTMATSNARGCRVCLAVCPYTRKNNWMHKIAKQIDARDPSGLAASTMLEMQKKFFRYPGGQQYYPPPDGNNASYMPAPKWLKTDEWFNI